MKSDLFIFITALV